MVKRGQPSSGSFEADRVRSESDVSALASPEETEADFAILRDLQQLAEVITSRLVAMNSGRGGRLALRAWAGELLKLDDQLQEARSRCRALMARTAARHDFPDTSSELVEIDIESPSPDDAELAWSQTSATWSECATLLVRLGKLADDLTEKADHGAR